jgi:hypothetical protein
MPTLQAPLVLDKSRECGSRYRMISLYQGQRWLES